MNTPSGQTPVAPTPRPPSSAKPPNIKRTRSLKRTRPSTGTGGGFRGVWPCLLYLIVDFGRPMAWASAIGMLKPGLLAAAWGLGAVVTRAKRPIPRPVWYMFGLMALMAWNVPWAVNNYWALIGLQDFAILILGGVLPLAVLPSSVATMRSLMTAYVVINGTVAWYALRHNGKGPGGWMGDENDLALAMNVAIGIAVYLVMESGSTMRRWLFVGLIGLMLAAVVVSDSRGGFVGLAVLGAYLMVYGPYRRVIAGLAVVGALGLAVMAPAEYWDEIRSIRSAGQEGDTGETRLYFWGLGWDMFLDHPITGVGTNNFGIRAPEYQDPNRGGWRAHTWGRVSHSMYFTLIPEQGLIGIGLFVALIAWCFKASSRLRRIGLGARDPDRRTAVFLASGLTAGIVGVLASGAFLSVLYYPVLWVLAGMLGSLDAIVQAPEPATEPASSKKRPAVRRRRSAAPAT